MTKKHIIVTKEREIKVCADLWHTSYCLYQKGVENPIGSNHQFKASLIFSAFALEAYLNHIGCKLFKDWEEFERLSPRGKFVLITDKLGIKINNGHRPWQTLGKLIGFRNYNAHGKHETPIIKIIKYKITDDVDKQLGDLLLSEWDKYCNEKTALRAREDIKSIVMALHDAGKFKNDYPFTHGIQIGCAGLIEPKAISDIKGKIMDNIAEDVDVDRID